MLNAVKHFFVSHRQTIANLLMYFLASLVPMLLNIGSMPVFAKYLSAEDFAVVGFYNSLSLLFEPMITFYMLHNYMRKYFQCDEVGREKLHTATFQLLIFFSAGMAAIAIILTGIYQNYFNKNSQIAVIPFAVYAMLYPAATGIFKLKLTDLKMKKRSLPYFIYNSVNAVLTAGVSVLLVILGGGCAGKLGGLLLGAVPLFAYLLWEERKNIIRKIDFKSAKSILAFCFPLTLAAMMGFFSNGYDKVFLERYIPLKELGYYSVGVSISHFLYVFSDAINSTFSPDIYESVAINNYKRCAKIVLLKLGLISAIVIPFIIFAPLIVNLLTAGRYRESLPFCIITALSAVTASLYYSFSQITIAANHNHIPLLSRIIGSLLTVLMFYILIKRWGTYGAAWGVSLNFLLYFICNVILLNAAVLLGKHTKNKTNEILREKSDGN